MKFKMILVLLACAKCLCGQSFEQVLHSDIIVYGEIFKIESRKDNRDSKIYTLHTIKVSKVLKGSFDTLLVVQCNGGEYEGEIQFSFHEIGLPVAGEGYFFLNMMEEDEYAIPSGKGAFLRCEDSMVEYNHKNIRAVDFERNISNILKFPVVYFDKWDIGNLVSAPDSCSIITENVDNSIIEFFFDSINVNSTYDTIRFDVMAKTNMVGVYFAGGTIDVRYDSAAFGENVIQNDRLDIRKGNIVIGDNYEITKIDKEPNVFSVDLYPVNLNSELTRLGSIPESVVSVEVPYSDFSSISSFNFDSLDVVDGSISYWCDGQTEVFDEVVFGDSIVAVNSVSGSPKSLKYIMRNGHMVENSNNTKYSLEIWAESSPNTRITNGAFYLNYSNEAFGNAIVINESVELIREEVIDISQVYPGGLLDFPTTNTLEVVFGWQFDSDDSIPEELFSPLNDNAKKVCTIIFDVIDCEANRNLYFDPFIHENPFEADGPFLNTWYNVDAQSGDFLHVLYDDILTEGNDLGSGCDCTGDPIITSFDPTSIGAGDGQILTIYGDNFGEFEDLVSTVKFKNGDDPLFEPEYTTTAKAYFEEWSNSKIRVVVPSVDFQQIFKGPASSGKFIVRGKCGMVESNNPLNIEYSLLNYKNPNSSPQNDRAVKVRAAATDGDGIVFRMNENVHDNDVVKGAFRDALSKWCQTVNANFIIGAPLETNDPVIPGDNLNTVGFTTNGALASLKLLGYFEQCSSNSSNYKLVEWDFTINSEINASYLRYYNIFLHELGHAHMLNHATYLDVSQLNQSVMIYSEPASNNASFIQNGDKEGALKIFPNAVECGGLGSGDCTVGTSEIENLSDYEIFPNPTNGIINVSAYRHYGRINVTDISGKLLLTFTNYSDEIDLSGLSAGLYLLNFVSHGSLPIVKRIFINE